MAIDATLIGREYYVFRDSTHNLIFIENPDLGKLLRKLLDTAEFQRLRRIRQNGLGFLVYPSMETTRFPHSVGSFAVAKQVIEALSRQQPLNGDFGFPASLEIDPISADGFCIAAALHDIGHGPLSHTWELISKRLALFDQRFGNFNHEKAGSELVHSAATELGELLKTLQSHEATAYERNVIKSAIRFLKNEHHLVFLRPLLAGNLDIDRLDFINRDTRAAGVTYGDHDLDWLIRSMRFGRLPQTDLNQTGIPWVIAIDARKGINALVQYLRARENMYSLVYLHKTVRAANAHLGSILVYAAHLLDRNHLDPGASPILQYLKTTQLPDRGIADIDDTEIWNAIKSVSNCENDLLRDLAKRFLSRRLFKSRRVSPETAAALEAMVKDGRFGARIRLRLQKFQAAQDQELISNKLLCDLFVIVDNADYDVIGEDKARENQTWIMYRRHIDIGLISLREYWEKNVSAKTSREVRFVHFIPEIEADILEFVTPLEGAFAGITEDHLGGKPKAAAAVEQDEGCPNGYTIIRLLSDKGKHKKAFLGTCKMADASEQFLPGEVCVLKKYRALDDHAADAMRDCIDNIYRIQSGNLAKSTIIREGKTTWLVERFWASDLLNLTRDAGIRTDLNFLLHMARDLFQGLSELARKNIRHGDIKLENCGVVTPGSNELLFQIGDFGLANAAPESVPGENALGTLTTRPPELLQAPGGRRVSLKSDVWSLAATIYASAVGRYPFIELTYRRSEKDAKAKEITANLPELENAFRAEFERKIPPVVADILRPCLFEPPSLRPTAVSVAGKLAGVLADCEAAGNSPMLWQRGLDALRVSPWARYNPSISESISKELSAILDRGKQWISPELNELASRNGTVSK